MQNITKNKTSDQTDPPLELEIDTMKNALKNPSSKKDLSALSPYDEKKSPTKDAVKNKPSPFLGKTVPSELSRADNKQSSNFDAQKKAYADSLEKNYVSPKKTSPFSGDLPSDLPTQTTKENISPENNPVKNKFDDLSPKTTDQKIITPLTSLTGSKESYLKKDPFLNEESMPEKTKKNNWLLLGIALFVLLLAVGAGLYYYLSVTKKSADQTTNDIEEAITPSSDTNNSPSESIDTSSSDNNMPHESQDAVTPLATDNFSKIKQLSFNTDLVAEIKDVISTAKIGKDSSLLLDGYFMQVVQNETPITPVQLLNHLKINLKNLESVVWKDKAFIFLNQLKADGPVKVSLLLPLDAKTNTTLLKNNLKNQEKYLPVDLKPLFIDETAPYIVDLNTISFNPSLINNAVRYLNYTPGNPDKSIDWGIISKNENSYLIFSTAKKSTEQLIKALETTDFSNDNSNSAPTMGENIQTTSNTTNKTNSLSPDTVTVDNNGSL